VSGEDRVLIAPSTGSGSTTIDTAQLALSGTLNTNNVSSISTATAIPTDTPSAGFIRVADDDGFYRRIKYSSYSGSTFTIDTTYHGSADTDNPGNTTANDFDTGGGNVIATSGNNIWVAYIDDLASSTESSFTSVFLSTRNLVVKVRDGGGSPIKEFLSSAQLTSGGGSATAIRTSDA
jgi:hypothetical protein